MGEWESAGGARGLEGEVCKQELEAFARLRMGGDERGAREMLARNPALARARGAGGRTALIQWAGSRAHGMLADLMALGGLEARSDDGTTALMMAAAGRDARAVEMLLPGSDARAQDKEGVSALMIAAGAGSRECVEALLPWSDVFAAGLWNGASRDAEEAARANGYAGVADLIGERKRALVEKEELSGSAGPGRASRGALRV